MHKVWNPNQHHSHHDASSESVVDLDNSLGGVRQALQSPLVSRRPYTEDIHMCQTKEEESSVQSSTTEIDPKLRRCGAHGKVLSPGI